MSDPFRSSEFKAPEAPPAPKVPWFWRLRVWWASRHVSIGEGDNMVFHFQKTNNYADSYAIPWERIEDFADAWEKTPAGEPIALVFTKVGGQDVARRVMIVSPACVPTMARLARAAADEWSRAPRKKGTP